MSEGLPGRHRSSEQGDDIAARYHLLLELSPDAIAVHQSGAIVFCNRAAVQFARVRSAADMIGRSIAEFVHPDSLEEMFARLLEMGEQVGAVAGPDDVVMVDALGEPRPMQVTSVRTLWDDQPAYQVVLRDTSAEREADAITRRQAALVDHVSDAVVSVDEGGYVETWNPAAERLYGVSAVQAVGKHVSTLMGAELEHPQWIVDIGGGTDLVQTGREGQPWPARVNVTEMDAGWLIVAHAVRTPLEARLAAILAALDQALIVVRCPPDGHAVVELVNPAATSMMGLTTGPIGVPVSELPLEFLDSPTPIDACLESGRSVTDATARVTVRRSPRWVTCSCSKLDDDRIDALVLLSLLDITDRHHRTSELAWQATHDHLTGTLSRAGILRAIESLLSSERPGNVCVCYLDLNGFKTINDTLGHQAGDLILCVVARRLQTLGSLPEIVVGRIGGDEFVLAFNIPPGKGTGRVVDEVREQALSTIARPIEVYSRIEGVSASIGICLSEGRDGVSAMTLLGEADIALYKEKARIRGRG